MSSENREENVFDVLIAGGGPGGAISAICLARAGLRCAILEKGNHPRFHIGESILPRCAPLIHEMGLWDKLKQLPHEPKFGISFAFGDNPKYQPIVFDDGMEKADEIFNVERSNFDKLLLEEAKKEGAAILENTGVKKIIKLSEGDVELKTDKGNFSARMLIDASGHSAIVARHFGRKKMAEENELQKVAYFEHFTNVDRPQTKGGGSLLVMCEEGWFWIIGLNDTVTSIGFVTGKATVKRAGVPADQMLDWALKRCPVMQTHMRNAKGPQKNKVIADYSYSCAPFAGEGYFLVGDAACFLDPIFSTGVTLAMLSGREAAKHTIGILKENKNAQKERNSYDKLIAVTTNSFKKIICKFYHHPFREILMCPGSPLQLRPAFISVLAGYIFPKMRWRLRWRMQVLFGLAKAQRYFPVVPRYERFSLFDK